MITRADVEAARERVGARVRRTPLLAVGAAFGGTGWLKLEYLQHTGTFKARGAFNRILAASEDGSLDPEVGIVVASGGNAGLANAFAARALGVPATVFVPENAPALKVDKLRTYGAEVVLRRQRVRRRPCRGDRARARRPVPCTAMPTTSPRSPPAPGRSPWRSRRTWRGRWTPSSWRSGGGGLMAGVAAATEGSARVVGVEPSSIPTLHTALAEGRPTDVAVSGIAADSLGARRLGDIAYAVAARTDVRSVLVDDDDIVRARRLLWEDHRIVVEHGAAAALAALTSGAYRPAADERVVVVLCGANTDPASLRVERPSRAAGRG